MKYLFFIFPLIVFSAVTSVDSYAQTQKKKPPETNNNQNKGTPDKTTVKKDDKKNKTKKNDSENKAKVSDTQKNDQNKARNPENQKQDTTSNKLKNKNNETTKNKNVKKDNNNTEAKAAKLGNDKTPENNQNRNNGSKPGASAASTEKTSKQTTAATPAPAEEEEEVIIVPSSQKHGKHKKINAAKNNKKNKEIAPAPEEEEDIVVTGTMTKRKLKDVPVKTEVIRKEKIEAKGAVNVIKALDSEVGVHIDNQCSLCNTTTIKLSGLPGRYTLFLVDGMPLYSSLGSTYGLAGIVTAFVDRIEIVKGASSVLYGSSAIGGVVNVITKRPSGRHAELEVKYGSYGYNYTALGASHSKSGVFGDGTFMGMSVVATHEGSDSIDRDNDHITEFAAFERSLLGGNIYLHPGHNIDILFRTTVLQGQRHGGGKGALLEVINDWNPDTRTGRRAFTESILTKRMENGLTLDIYEENIKANLTMAMVYHKQDSDYESEYYLGKQWLFYISPNIRFKMGKHYGLLTGASFRQEKLSENLAVSDYNYRVSGVFAEGNLHFGKKFELLHGARYDYHNVFGSIFTPRIAVKYALLKNLTLRAATGTGFRAPTTFYEYNHGVHPGGYVVQMDAKNAEHSLGGTFSINWNLMKDWNLTLETAYNKVEDAIAIESLNSGAIMRVFNVGKPLEVYAAEAQIEGKISKMLNIYLGYGNYHYKDEDHVMVSAPPTQQFTMSLLFKHKKWSGALNTKLYAPMDLRKVYGFAYNPQKGASLDELLDPATGADINNPKLEKSPWWGTVDIRVEHKLTKQLHIYFGVDNLLDYHQNDTEGPVFFPADAPGASPGMLNATYIWGPLKGRFIYAGMKLSL